MEKVEGQDQQKLMTMKELLRDQPTIRQLDILARADRLFADKFSDGKGRYYGGILTGILTEEEIDALDPEYKKRSQS
ncbi:MAG: hypothetical protein HYT62_05140 [Candidatus Yanofskybacteria bacterium]|nr:hypothetical protein [Candidatus Yanofskybacteria bacterium]